MKARQRSNQPKFVANLISVSSQFFIALFVATLAVAVQGSSYVEPAWSVGLSNHGLTAYPYGPVHQWAPAVWPVTYGGRKTQVEPIVVKTNSWDLPATAYGYGYNQLGAITAVTGKYVAPIAGLVHQAPLVGYGVNQKVVVGGHGY